MKKKVTVLLALVMCMSLIAGCSSANSNSTASTPTADVSSAAPSQAAAPADDKEDIYIAMIAKGYSNPYWQSVKNGAEKAAAEVGVSITFEGVDNEAYVDKQIEMMDAALAKKPAALCIAALDKKACEPILEKAEQMGIPVITFDSGVDSDYPSAFCATDNYGAAALAADKMAELIGKEGDICVIAQDQVAQTSVDRRDGFLDTIKEKYPDIKVIDIQYGDGDPLKSTEIAKTMIQSNPNLKGIFGSNEGSAVGVVNAKRELGNTDVVAVGYDAGMTIKDGIRDGIMAGAITQDPIGMGYMSILTAYDVVQGKEVTPFVNTGFHWYNAENIDSDEIKPLLYD